ncbi:FecR family protein [Pedobacter petrophilus]|nr:FecR domain-containing protein [Pedobacter petrophilus]
MDQLSDYQSGTMNSGRREIVDKWFGKQNRVSPDILSDNLGDEIFDVINKKIPVNKPKRTSLFWAWSVAASLLIFFAATLLFLGKVSRSRDPLRPAAYTTYLTKSRPRHLILEDGTSVDLKPGSLFRVMAGLNKSSRRRVFLDRGEAFFKVKRDPAHPFIISSGNYKTTVLGTSFIINTNSLKKTYTVSVKTGKVRVEHQVGHTFRILSAGLIKNQVLHYDELTRKTLITGGEKVRQTGKENYLTTSIEQKTLIQIGALISKAFGVKVDVREQAVPVKYTLELDYYNLEHTLNKLAMQTGIRYELNGHSLLIIPGK